MKIIKYKKYIAVIVVAVILLVASVFFIVPTTANSTITVPFGELKVEIYGVDEGGEYNIMEPSSILGQTMEFTRSGADVSQIQVMLFAIPSGEGWDFVELDLATAGGVMLTTLKEGGSTIGTEVKNYDGPDTQMCPLNTQTLIWAHHIYLNQFEDDFDTAQTHTFTIEIDFDMDIQYRGSNGGAGTDLQLPVSGTCGSTWEQTWTTPVYIATFYGNTDSCDLHLKYKNSAGDWIEFDNRVGSNGWENGPLVHTINDNTYGMSLAGWNNGAPDNEIIWSSYTDAGGTSHTTVPLGGSGGEPGPWESTIVHLDIDTSTLTWNSETPDPYCGDGTCNNGETCETCEQDCGPCDSRFTGFSLHYSGGGITYDVCSPRINIEEPGQGYSGWQYYEYTSSCGATPNFIYPINFYYTENTRHEVYIKPTEYGGTLIGHIEVHGPNGEVVNLGYNSWSAITDTEVTTSPTGGEWGDGWYNLAGYTGTNNHAGDWTVHYYIHHTPPGGSTNYKLTIEPQDATNVDLEITVGGSSDDSSPYEFWVAGGSSWSATIDWYGNGEVTSSESGTMPHYDTTVEADHPNSWLIYLYPYGGVPYYDFCCDKILPGTGQDCVYDVVGAQFYRPTRSLAYQIGCQDANGAARYSSIDLSTGGDNVYMFNFNTGGLATMKSYTFGGQVSGDAYRQGDKYLGVL